MTSYNMWLKIMTAVQTVRPKEILKRQIGADVCNVSFDNKKVKYMGNIRYMRSTHVVFTYLEVIIYLGWMIVPIKEGYIWPRKWLDLWLSRIWCNKFRALVNRENIKCMMYWFVSGLLCRAETCTSVNKMK